MEETRTTKSFLRMNIKTSWYEVTFVLLLVGGVTIAFGGGSNLANREHVLGKQRYSLLVSPESPGFAVLDEQSETIVELVDANQDGRPDQLRYVGRDEKGTPVLEVLDCGVDGQADVRWHLPMSQEEGYLEVYHQGTWHKVVKAEKPYITINGNTVTLSNRDGCLRVAH
jgi:hypothetical protein